MGTRGGFLVAQARPGVADAGRELGGDGGHALHRAARAAARCGLAEDFDGGAATGTPAPRFAPSCHFPVITVDSGTRPPWALRRVPLAKLVGQHARGRLALDIDLLDAAAALELVDIDRAECALNQRVEIGNRHARGAEFLTIDLQLILRCVPQAVGADGNECRVLRRGAQQLVAGIGEGRVAFVGLVDQFHVEPAGIAEFDHRRRREDEDLTGTV